MKKVKRSDRARGVRTRTELRADLESSKAHRQARSLLGDLASLLNGGSQDEVVAGLVDGLRHEHRYLQAKTVWVLLETLGSLSRDRTDLRNAAAIDACAVVAEVFKGKISDKHKMGA